MSDRFGGADELENFDNEELKELRRRIEEAKNRRQRLEEKKKGLESIYTTDDTAIKLEEGAKTAKQIVESQKFKVMFCGLYNNPLAETTVDIAEVVIEIGFSAVLPPIVTALIIITLRIFRYSIDKYCSD